MVTDPLSEIKSQLQHPFIRERRKAIERLAELLQDPASRNEVILLLQDRAKNDVVTLRELAQKILDEDARKNPEYHLGEGAEHTFGVKCTNPKCRHVTYFDKREVCSKYINIYRDKGGNKKGTLHEMLLPCEVCGTKTKVEVDCEGYQ